MYKGLASYFLPDDVLDYFDVVDFAEEPTFMVQVLLGTRRTIITPIARKTILNQSSNNSLKVRAQ